MTVNGGIGARKPVCSKGENIIYEFTEIMREISGFGGGYEAACRAMLKAGLEWGDKNPNADPKFHGFKNIYGIIQKDNEDAKALRKVVVRASGDDCSGAMHQAVISSILWIRKNGWDRYVEEMSKEKNDKDKS